MARGVEVDDDVIGNGRIAERGGSITIRYDLALNRGDVVQAGQVATFVLGKRTVIAGLEYGVQGMRVGGRRRLRISPHLGYGAAGVPGVVPPNAVLLFQVELLDVQ